jgi:hypothetical protein
MLRAATGNNTLHIMGIIQIVTPKSSVLLEEPIPRIKEIPSVKDFAVKVRVNTGLSKRWCSRLQ